MNDQTQIQPYQPSRGSSAVADLGMELTKMLALVAPVTMSTDQQEIWLRAAIDSLRDIRPQEVARVSLEVRRSVTRPSQIVPEISRLVAEHRSRDSRIRELSQPAIEGPPLKKHVMDRDRSTFTAEDWADLSDHLEKMGSRFRYRADGSRYEIEGD